MKRLVNFGLSARTWRVGPIARCAAVAAGWLLAAQTHVATASFPAVDARGVPVINGKPLVELDGPVGHVVIDYSHGALGYLVETGGDVSHRIFAARSIDFAGARGPEIGTVILDTARGSRNFTATGSPGQHIAFSGMLPCYGAVILTRGSLIVRVAADGLAAPQTLSEGWEAMPGDPRGGDSCGTGLVVVHRLRRASVLQSLTPVNDRYDYGVARVTDGHVFEIPVTSDPHGSTDDPLGHQIDFRRIEGRVLVAFIGPRTLHAQLLDVDTGKQVIVFERGLGLASLRFEDTPGGPTALGVDFGFGRKRQEDIARWFAAQP